MGFLYTVQTKEDLRENICENENLICTSSPHRRSYVTNSDLDSSFRELASQADPKQQAQQRWA